ncbi:MAG: TonB-dependent receptor [Acidobacteriota bacterium]|nr:TonB-dependent receptor [Acidobacteriota bacterium]
MRTRSALVGVLVLLLSGLLIAQRADRATITGVVTDPSGNNVAGASVKVRNDDTRVETALTTNEAGTYTSPLLVLGPYTVTVEHPGFKISVHSGLQLTGGQVFRQDAVLELGTVAERVEVSASAEMLNTEQPDVANSVGEQYYRNLPVVMGADIRLAEALLQLQPGYTPMRPNGDPMFRGSQFGSRINGGQSFATENFFDGVAFGYAAGHQDSHESAPPIESVGEMRVIEGSYSAQYGHTSGGTIEYTSRTGTKDLHGSLYEYLANDAFNARGFFPAKVSKIRSNAYGFTVGGPVVIPKVYDGRNKTFFFTNLDWLKYRSGVLPGFGNTTPTDAFKRGDFSSLLTGGQVGADVLGRPVLDGQIFDPSTTRLVNGVPVRDSFPGNIIPPTSPLRSVVASRIVPLIVAPDRPGTAFNVAGLGTGDQTWVGNFNTILFRVDHQFNQKFKTTSSFFRPKRPAIRHCANVGGCNAQFDPETSSSKNTDYFGQGFFQRIVTHHATQQFDAIIKPNLLWHGTVAWDRWFMGGNSISAGVNWPDRLWGTDKSGLVDKTAGPPQMNFSGNIPYTRLGTNWTGFGFEAINRWQFANDLTWIAGRHQIKMGYEFRHHQFNFHGWATGTGGNFNFNRLGTGGYDANGNSLSATGDPFASFLLGQVQSADFNIPLYTTFNGNYTAGFVNDEFKITNHLTLTMGLRFDYQGAWTERHDSFSTFDPSVPNPLAGGRLGATVFAGKGPGRTGSRTFDKIPLDAWGPRFGFAYRLGDKTVFRGGYGMYYAGVAFGNGPTPIQGFNASPTAANVTNGLYPAFNLDAGFPRNVIQYPPFINPSVANGTSPAGYVPAGLTLPRYQNWSFTVQRQLTGSMVMDVSYIANHGTRLPHNAQFLGVADNMNDPAVLALGTKVLQADINSPEARAAGIALPYPGFVGNVAQAIRPFPQYQTINYRDVPIGSSIYHAFQAQVEKRFSQGMQFRVFYTFSKLINDRAESGQQGGCCPQNPIATQRPERNVSGDDVPHTFVVAYTYELPFAKNSTNGVIHALASGWTLNGLLRYESGRPMLITMTNDLAGLLFNGTKRPNRVAGTSGLTDLGGRKFDPNRDRYLDRSGWSDPGPLQFGNAPSRDGSVRGFRNATEDVSIFKETKFGERYKFRIEVQGGNITNRVVFCDPNQNFSAGSFGQVSTQCNQPRSIQFGTKFEF